MPDEGQDLLAVRLDADRRKEIDGIKQRFEDWARSQTELNIALKHEMELVVKGQEALKERFEAGTANTLKELKSSFDQFRVEWGAKGRDDQIRDRRLDQTEEETERVKVWMLRLSLAIFAPISVGLAVSFIVWAFSRFGGP